MKLALIALLSAPMASAFAPPTAFRSTTQLSAIDPSAIHDLSQHSSVAADSINHFFSSMLISDLDVDAVNSAAATIPLDAAPGAGAADVAAEVAKADDNGWFGFLTLPIEGLLKLIHAGLASAGVEEAWGLSIIGMTLFIKILTFPLTKGQLESTNKMQVSEVNTMKIMLWRQSLILWCCKQCARLTRSFQRFVSFTSCWYTLSLSIYVIATNRLFNPPLKKSKPSTNPILKL